jgi:hypothetical protein
MIELNEEQRRELSAPEPVVIDPVTRETYVLVRKDVYDRIKDAIYDDSDETADELRLRLARSAAENGWDEPGMEDYDQYDAKRPEECRRTAMT